MNTKRFSIYGGKDPRDMPAYSVAEASRITGVGEPTLRYWITGHNKAKPAIVIPSRKQHVLSYTNVVEAFVLGAIRRRNVKLQNVRKAIDYLEKQLEVPHPLAREPFQTDGVDLFVERFGELINASSHGQIAMREVLAIYLERIEYDKEGLPAILYPFPFKREPKDQPRVIAVNPFIQFGRPVIAGTRIPTDILAERFYAGETIEQLAEDYDRDPSEIQVALQYQARTHAA
jgi:uncharacterized protein (DUF433 family)